MLKNYYQRKKEQAREEAQNTQQANYEAVMSWSELYLQQARLYKIGKRYGLLREFKENGIL